MDRCEKTREALAGRRKKQHVGRLSPESHPDIERRRLLPARRRIIVVPRAILLEAEKVEDSAGVPGHLLVVAHRAGVDIDAADALIAADDVRDPRRRLVEAFRSDTDSAEQVGMGDDLFRSEEHTSELQSLMRISYAVF